MNQVAVNEVKMVRGGKGVLNGTPFLNAYQPRLDLAHHAVGWGRYRQAVAGVNEMVRRRVGFGSAVYIRRTIT